METDASLENEEVILEIEGSQIQCKKKELSEHSDYFKAMFEGSFAERTQKVIKIEGVDLRAMNILLALLWDESYFIQDEDALLVLQASCMLQFDRIKSLCLEKITEILSPDTCMNIWLITEQLDLTPLWLKAKTMALEEFTYIKDLDCLLELSLKQLFRYLANRNLNCENEVDVFQTCMKWWYENSKLHENDIAEVLFALLTCLDYNSLSDSDIKEMKTYPDIKCNEEVVAILDCLLNIRQNNHLIHNDAIVNKAKILAVSQNRKNQEYPCFTFNKKGMSLCMNVKGVETSELLVVYYDMFKRKRLYSVVEGYEQPALTVVYYDSHECKVKEFINIARQKCEGLDGFKLVGYKEFVFLFGGEFLIGKGNWNKNFWVYDNVCERWERKCLMPCKRRHFESCLCGNYLYIIGGTGDFRVIQVNMLWYNYKEDKWSNEIVLPCSERQIKCCDYKKQLFLLNMNNKCGYLFNVIESTWFKMDICDTDNVVPNFSDKYALFSYKNSIFIKAEKLIEMKIIDNKLVVVSSKVLKPMNCDQIESVLCNKMLFTLYVQKVDIESAHSHNDIKRLILERFCLDTLTISNVFEIITINSYFDFNGGLYYIPEKLHLFKFRHHDCAIGDHYITTHRI